PIATRRTPKRPPSVGARGWHPCRALGRSAPVELPDLEWALWAGQRTLLLPAADGEGTHHDGNVQPESRAQRDDLPTRGKRLLREHELQPRGGSGRRGWSAIQGELEYRRGAGPRR